MKAKLSEDEATGRVASFLNRGGYSKPGKFETITARTVKGWRESAMSGNPSEDWIARRYQNILSGLNIDQQNASEAAKLKLQAILSQVPARKSR